jgi:hypothetical protein
VTRLLLDTQLVLLAVGDGDQGVARPLAGGPAGAGAPGAAAGFRWLPIRNSHLLAVAELETDGEHRDPFDRLLVCQSRTEPMLLLTAD